MLCLTSNLTKLPVSNHVLGQRINPNLLPLIFANVANYSVTNLHIVIFFIKNKNLYVIVALSFLFPDATSHSHLTKNLKSGQ